MPKSMGKPKRGKAKSESEIERSIRLAENSQGDEDEQNQT